VFYFVVVDAFLHIIRQASEGHVFYGTNDLFFEYHLTEGVGLLAKKMTESLGTNARSME
jgi:hypothetical protein